MFGGRYFGGRYFGARFFGHHGYTTPAGVRGTYMGPRYFGRRYFNQKAAEVDGHYFGVRYFGTRYFGQGYYQHIATIPFALEVTTHLPALTGAVTFSSVGLSIKADWELAQSGALALSATLPTTADFDIASGEEWSFTPPLELPTAVGRVALAADFSFSAAAAGVGRYFGPRYWGRDYFGPYYWGTSATWGLQVTLGLTLNGTTTLGAGLGLALSVNPTPLQAIGTLTLAANLVIVAGFQFEQTNALAANAAVTLASDLRYDTVENLATTASLDVGASLTLAADLEFSAIAFLELTNALAVDGTVGFRLPYGDFVFYRPPPPPSRYPEDGAEIPNRPRWRRTYAKGWLAEFVDQAPEDTPGATPGIQ